MVQRSGAACGTLLLWLTWMACSPANDAPSDKIVGRSPTGGRAASSRPSLSVTLRNAGSADTYHFQLADDSLFDLALESGPVKAESSHVKWQPAQDLEVGRIYYWRVGAMDGGPVLWDTIQRFVGGPPLNVFPNPYCCKWTKSHRHITIDGMAPPAQLQIVTATGEVVFELQAIREYSYAWNIANQDGTPVPNGDYEVKVDDRLGHHELRLRIVRPD